MKKRTIKDDSTSKVYYKECFVYKMKWKGEKIMNQERIGKFIADMRKKKGLTQKEFAEKIGVTDKTVSRWENGHYLPDVSLFNELCKILDIEVTELLNGEKMKENINKEEVNETITKIVTLSTDEIKKKKRNVINISIVIICVIIVTFGSLVIWMKERRIEKNKPGDSVPFPKQIAYREKEDGWICSFSIEYFKDDLEYPYYYGYDCENFKYPELYDFKPTGQEVDSNGNTYEYKTSTNHPQYIFHSEYGDDIVRIDEYFTKQKFNTTITMSDLDDLNLKLISKEEVLELYNEAISEPKIVKWGKQIITQKTNYLTVSLIKDDYTWYVGYIVTWGHIHYVSIELKIKDVYLSDLVKQNKATEEQRKIYQNITEIENYIIEKQTFRLPKSLENQKPYQFLNDNFSQINHIED